MNLGFSEVLFLVFLAMLVVGPRKLPQVAREVGKALAQFKRATADLQAQIARELDQAEAAAMLAEQQRPAVPQLTAAPAMPAAADSEHVA